MQSFYDLAEFESLVRELRLDPHVGRLAQRAYFKKAHEPLDAISESPAPLRDALSRVLVEEPLHDIRTFESRVDRATKIVSHNRSGFALETVLLRPATGRVALCVSSQVGCAAACAFCATGHMGVAKNLSAAEILHQVTIANRSLHHEGLRVRNIVFMGMGEPLHNEAAVSDTLSVLLDPRAFDHPASRILVSTVGVPDALVRVARRFPTVRFALSLHSAVADTRKQIVPLARRHSLGDLRSAVATLNAMQPEKNPVMIEYVMLDSVNDDDAAAGELITWLHDLRVHVNLIPFNPIRDAPELRASPRSVIERFRDKLHSAGFEATIRYSLGRDIDAACGQLVRDENRDVARRFSRSAGTTSPRQLGNLDAERVAGQPILPDPDDLEPSATSPPQ